MAAKTLNLGKGKETVLVEEGSVMDRRWREKGYQPIEPNAEPAPSAPASHSPKADKKPEDMSEDELHAALKAVGFTVPKNTGRARLLEIYGDKVAGK